MKKIIILIILAVVLVGCDDGKSAPVIGDGGDENVESVINIQVYEDITDLENITLIHVADVIVAPDGSLTKKVVDSTRTIDIKMLDAAIDDIKAKDSLTLTYEDMGVFGTLTMYEKEVSPGDKEYFFAVKEELSKSFIIRKIVDSKPIEEEVIETNTCAEICADKGYTNTRCVGEKYEGEKIKCGRSEIVGGVATNCDEGEDNAETTYICCCDNIEPETMTIIKVYTDVPGVEGQSEIANIFMNNGEVVTSFIFEDDAISEAVEVAQSTELTLLSEGPEIIDGEQALVMRGDVITPSNPSYLLVLRGYLASDYKWVDDVYDFDLVEVTKWKAYKDYQPVIEFGNKPGVLVSTALPTLDSEPTTHHFLTGSVLVAEEEDNLKAILNESTSFTEFLAKLNENGYAVLSEEGMSLLR